MKKLLSLFLVISLCFAGCIGIYAAEAILYGDVSADGKINATDALYILQYTVGKRYRFPCEDIQSAPEPDEPAPAPEPVEPDPVPDDKEPKVAFGLTQTQMDQFAPVLDGLFTGKTTETIERSGLGGSFAMHFPDVIEYKNQYYAYYITYQTNTGKGGVGLATSEDGLNWKNQGCVLQPGEDYDCNGAYFAGVWLDTDGKIYLTYECKGGEGTSYGTLENIALAVSKDGRNFTKEGVILYKDKSLPWQTANVGTPDLYKVGSMWYMTFHGYNYVDCQIGVAYGTDLHDLSVVKTPVIPTAAGTAYSGTTGRRDVIYVGGYYYMVYEVSTDAVSGAGYNGAKWTHMFARSKDMIQWETIKAPLLTQKDGNGNDKTGFGYDGPCWCVIKGELYVLMRNTSNSTTAVKLTLSE